MRVSLALLAVAAAAAAGWGNGVKPINGDNAPAVTSPGTTIPYESGGADGAGGAGRVVRNPRGGVAAGQDSGSGS